jgi:hypothetical protein
MSIIRLKLSGGFFFDLNFQYTEALIHYKARQIKERDSQFKNTANVFYINLFLWKTVILKKKTFKK